MLEPDADGDVVPLVLEPDADGEVVPLVLEPDTDGDVVPLVLEPDGDVVPEADGALVLLPLDDRLPEPDVPEPDEVGDADGDWASAIPATCIACWLQRSKSARLSEPPPASAALGRSRAAIPTDANVILVMMNLLHGVATTPSEYKSVATD